MENGHSEHKEEGRPSLVVLENPDECPLPLGGIETVSARAYLTDPNFSSLKGCKVFNICRSYRYQSIGYYVSLLAEARKHKPVPSITTIQDMKSISIIRLASYEMEEALKKHLPSPETKKVSFNIYFGNCPEKRFESIGSQLFKYFHAPFLRADFTYTTKWHLQNISPIPVKEIPVEEREFAGEVASRFFAGRKLVIPKREVSRYDLAILHNPTEKNPPSDQKALRRFAKAADAHGIGTELITREDSRRLSEFDALFIRETTNVDHHTYRIARLAMAEGLVVIDDPTSILRCSNKVYLAELLQRHKVLTPRTIIVHSKNLDRVLAEFSLPCILKQPDSSFSQGVVMVSTHEKLVSEAKRLLKKSELVIAQEFISTEFDWRIGILDRKPLYACRYYMARKHWQIIRRDEGGRWEAGRVETLPVEKVPKSVVKTALRAANLIGDGFYGVDLKKVGRKVYVIEVNDNPSIDAGYEDAVLKEGLYSRVMEVFLRRIEKIKAGSRNS